MEVMKKTIDSMFRNCTQQEREAIEDWPTFSEEDVTELNDLFDHYIFYQWETKETMRVWTSCCHRKATVHRISRVQTAAEYDLITTRHNGYLKCPFCKRAVQKKHINKIGKGLNLKAWRKAAVVHNREDGVYLTALHVQKEYNPERRSSFTALPEVKLASAYRFRPGEVMQVIDEYYGLYTVSYEIRKMGKRKEVQEPFHGAGYYGIGLRRLRESWLKYCQYDTYEGIQYSWAQRELNNLVDYLTVYSIYPKQVEMLVKMGMGQIVYRMEEERVKSSRIFDWDAKDIKAALQQQVQELQQRAEDAEENAFRDLDDKVKSQTSFLSGELEKARKDAEEANQRAVEAAKKAEADKQKYDQEAEKLRKAAEAAKKKADKLAAQVGQVPPETMERLRQEAEETAAKAAAEKLEKQVAQAEARAKAAEEQAAQAMMGTMKSKAIKAKYGNTATEENGIRFGSKLEARRFRELLQMEQAGEIWDLHLQEEFVLKPAYTLPDGSRSRAIKYVADFTYRRRTAGGGEERVVEDTKSRPTKTPVYRMKKKLMESVHGIIIQEVER